MPIKAGALVADAWLRTFIGFVLLKVLPFKVLIGIALRLRFIRYSGLSDPQRKMLFLWINRLTSRLSSNPCLLYSLVLYSMDARVDLAIGVRKMGDDLEGHAWIELEDRVFSTIDVTPLTCLMRYRSNGDLDVY